MRHAKPKAVISGTEATADPDTFLIQDGASTISGFDPAHDRLLFVGSSYSDILTLDKPHDGWTFDTFAGVHFEVHAGDFNSDGVTDTLVSGSDSTVILLGVDPDTLYGWNLAGG